VSRASSGPPGRPRKGSRSEPPAGGSFPSPESGAANHWIGTLPGVKWLSAPRRRRGPGGGALPLPFLSIRDLLAGVPDADAGRFHALCVERRFPRDAAIFRQDDEADALCILREGNVKLVTLSETGDDQILHILRPGDLFGELILLQEPRPFTAVAMTDAVVAVLPRAGLLELFAFSPAFTLGYLRLLSRRLHEVERVFSALVHAWPHRRLAKELLHLAEDLGEETPKGTRLSLHLTHEVLANLIGASRETVTLLIRKFEETGLLHREGRELFLNRDRLAEYLGLARIP